MSYKLIRFRHEWWYIFKLFLANECMFGELLNNEIERGSYYFIILIYIFIYTIYYIY